MQKRKTNSFFVFLTSLLKTNSFFVRKLENEKGTDNLFKKLYQWDPILLEKAAWKDIDSYLLFCLRIGLCLVNLLITIPCNLH